MTRNSISMYIMDGKQIHDMTSFVSRDGCEVTIKIVYSKEMDARDLIRHLKKRTIMIQDEAKLENNLEH